MVKEIRIYIEGGGDENRQKRSMIKGFSKFLKSVKDLACSQNITWNISMCGKRNKAFRDFKNALESHPEAFNILLVDAEVTVTVSSSWEHLKSRDNWDKPSGTDDSHCHLMVQTMEAWFIADIETLKQFYGQGFLENSIPKNTNVEEIEKSRLENSLNRATEKTGKGKYHKIKHAHELLQLLSVEKVRQASPHCDRLFKTLEKLLNS